MFNVHAGYKGIVEAVEVLKNGEVIKKLGPFENLFLDQGLTAVLRDSSTLGNGISVGSGTTPPTVLDTSLENEIAFLFVGFSNNITFSRMEGSYGIWSVTRTYTFNLGAVVGIVSELGLRNSNSSFNPRTLCTRTLLKDSQGNPTTLEILEDEQLRVTYTIEVWLDGNIKQLNKNFIINGEPIEQSLEVTWGTTNSFYLDSFGSTSIWRLVTISNFEPFSVVYKGQSNQSSAGTYINIDDFSRKNSRTFSVSQMNFNNFDGIVFNNICHPPIVVKLSTPMSKTNTQRMTLSYTISVGRV